MAFSKLMMLRENYGSIFNRTLSIIGGISSDISKTILRFVDESKIQVISSISSAVSLNNKDNFCRTIPDDSAQAQVMISILQKMNWTCAIGLYASGEYGTNGDLVLRKLTAKNNIKYSSQAIDDLDITKVNNFVENSQTDVVLIFSDLKKVKNYFSNLNTFNSKSKKVYIMGDSWVCNFKSCLIFCSFSNCRVQIC
jgi:uncharacterized protein YajQ (UPF0234 family)